MNKNKKCLIVASVASMVGQFNMPNIDLLLSMGYTVTVASNFSFGNTFNNSHAEDLWNKLKTKDVEVHNIKFVRNIFNLKNILVYKKIKKLINENNYSLIHCHSPIGGVITRLAAKKHRKNGTHVIYTAHGFHFHKGSPISNWLLYYPVEKWLSKYTDTLITINKEDFSLAQRKMHSKKIYYISGIGVDTQKFFDISVDKLQKRSELGISQNEIILLSVGELIKRKNHEVIIKAIAKLNNPKIKYFICGIGKLEIYLKNLVESLNLENQVILLGYRNDIGELCKASDIFCFPSKTEGLGIAAIEAMACGLPIITSNIHGINDYSESSVTGYSCNPTDINGFAYAIDKLIQDADLRRNMGEYNKKNVAQFNVSKSMQEMIKIYEKKV